MELDEGFKKWKEEQEEALNGSHKKNGNLSNEEVGHIKNHWPYDPEDLPPLGLRPWLMVHSPVKTAELLAFGEERHGHSESRGDVQPLKDDLADGLWLMFLSMGMSCWRPQVVRKGLLSRRSFILNLAAALTFLLWKPEPVSSLSRC